MTTLTILLAEILECGYADVSFIEKELEAFNVEVDDLGIEEMKANGTLTANELIYQIYQTVVDRHSISEDRVSIITNCLDSHLNIDSEEMYSEEDVRLAKLATEDEE